eukprot:1155386-Pelagomonas_calceolata.AAC.5
MIGWSITPPLQHSPSCCSTPLPTAALPTCCTTPLPAAPLSTAALSQQTCRTLQQAHLEVRFEHGQTLCIGHLQFFCRSFPAHGLQCKGASSTRSCPEAAAACFGRRCLGCRSLAPVVAVASHHTVCVCVCVYARVCAHAFEHARLLRGALEKHGPGSKGPPSIRFAPLIYLASFYCHPIPHPQICAQRISKYHRLDKPIRVKE